jgi:hypothetical protein
MRPTESDPVIDEVREIRHRISERFGHDPDRLVAYYMEIQKQFEDRLIHAESQGHPSNVETPRGASPQSIDRH